MMSVVILWFVVSYVGDFMKCLIVLLLNVNMSCLVRLFVNMYVVLSS